MTAATLENVQFSPMSWCIDSDTRDNVVARRNVLAGLWAGRLLGLSGGELTAYAVEVHLADFNTEGDADVVGKVAGHLGAAGVASSEQHVRDQLSVFHLEAFRQVAATD